MRRTRADTCEPAVPTPNYLPSTIPQNALPSSLQSEQNISFISAYMPSYHGYPMDYDWDRDYFMPFIQAYCFAFGWIPIVLAFVLIYLLFNHSPMYSREFRNAIAFYHCFLILYDIHHSYLFIPYPLFPMPMLVCHGFMCRIGAPTRLLLTFTGVIATFASFAISCIVFMRLRNLLALDSRFRISVRQSVVLMCFVFVMFAPNAVGFALFGGDDPRKADILNRSEFAWLREKPDVLVFGEMFDTPSFDIEGYYLGATLIWGFIFFSGILIYSGLAIHKEKKKLHQISAMKRTKDQANKMLLIQLVGVLFVFVIPVAMMIITVKIGTFSYNTYALSVSRVIIMFMYVNNSMVATLLHLIMNRVYQRIIISKIKTKFGLLKRPAKIEVAMSSTQVMSK